MTRRVPTLIEPEDVAAYRAGDKRAVRVPFIGGRTPRGWRRVGEPVFVDHSGLGSESEPAWTLRRFLEHLQAIGPSYWGTVESGQFQCYVQRFEPCPRYLDAGPPGLGRPMKTQTFDTSTGR